jgi:hypothetical protein
MCRVAFEDLFLKRPVGIATNRILTDTSLDSLDLESSQLAGEPFGTSTFFVPRTKALPVGIQSFRWTQNILGWNQIAVFAFQD